MTSSVSTQAARREFAASVAEALRHRNCVVHYQPRSKWHLVAWRLPQGWGYLNLHGHDLSTKVTRISFSLLSLMPAEVRSLADARIVFVDDPLPRFPQIELTFLTSELPAIADWLPQYVVDLTGGKPAPSPPVPMQAGQSLGSYVWSEAAWESTPRGNRRIAYRRRGKKRRA